MNGLIISLLRHIVTLGLLFRRFRVLKKYLLTFRYVNDPIKYCTEMMDIIIEVKLNASDSLLKKRKANSNVSQKIIEIREITDKVLQSSDIKIGVSCGRQRKIAYFKDNYTHHDQYIYFQKMIQFLRDIYKIERSQY